MTRARGNDPWYAWYWSRQDPLTAEVEYPNWVTAADVRAWEKMRSLLTSFV